MSIAADAPLLELEQLAVTFVLPGQRVEAVRDVSLRLAAGDTLTLLGESGSGKSVTSGAVLRLLGQRAQVRGRVVLDGQQLLELDPAAMRALRGRAVGLVPQDPTGSLDPLRRVGAQIVEVLRCHGVEPSRRAAQARAQELLRLVGIPSPRRTAAAYPHELSGGMRQRSMIAIAIACGPRLLIADEPTSALDVTIQAQVIELFLSLQQQLGMALLMVTHDVGVAREMDGAVAVMYAGRIVDQGPAARVLDHPAHPYTAGLLAAVPSPEVAPGHLLAIPGRPPGPGEDVGPGCAFAPRCRFALDSCRAAVPPLEPVALGGAARCPVVEPEALEPQRMAATAMEGR